MKRVRRNLLRDDVPIADALAQRPAPLLFPDRRLVVGWSAKSACTHVMLWYFNHIGRLDAALAHRHWPHVYRKNVLGHDPMIVTTTEILGGEGVHESALLKIMREPFKRCVSSFRHAVRTGYADRKMTRVLGRSIAARQGLSFRAFLDYLGRIDLADTNPHHAFQSHPVDYLGFGRRFFILAEGENLYEGLNRIEEICGLPRTDFAAVPAFSTFEKRHFAKTPNAPSKVEGDILDRPLGRQDAMKNWPKTELEASDEAREIVARLYARDYETIERFRPDSVA